MRCTVLVFAQLREALKRENMEIDLPEGAKVADAINALASQHSSIAAMRGRLAVAVNEQYARATQPLRADDRIALIPPVSGG